MNYLIRPSDWSATCHSKPLRSSTFIFNKADKSNELIHHMLADVSNNAFFRIISDQIMEVKAISLAA